MAVYIGHDECQVIYVAKNGQQLRVSSIWVGDQQVFPPANRQEVHLFTRDTQGYGRTDNGTHFGFTVPVPWWAVAVDAVIIGAGEKGRDGTKSFLGGDDGAGGSSGAWVVKTVALTQSTDAVVRVGKGTSTAPHATEIVLPGVGGQADVRVHDGEGARTSGNGSTGGSVTPSQRAEFDQTHTGGAGGSRNNPGNHPGGGGGGGQGSGLIGNPTDGKPGGDGYVWLRFRSAPGIEVFIIRVGVSSGDAFTPLREWAVSIGKTHETITGITMPMEVIGPSLRRLFYECSSLVSVPALDTSQVTNMFGMFQGCSSLTTIPALDTSQVTDTQYLFYGCSSLASVPELDTGQVTLMYGMFYECSSLASVPALDTSQVTNMRSIFNGCSSLTSVPELDTSNVTNMDRMFYGCSSLTTTPALNTSNVTDMRSMFYNCSSLTTIPALDTSQVTNMRYMLYGCSSLASVPALDTSQVTDMEWMFYNCVSLESVALPGMGNGFTTKQTLNMKATKLNTAAANALMQSLGTPPPGGVLELPSTATGANTSIATAKNWTVTIGDDGGFILSVGVSSGDANGPLREWAVSSGKSYQTITEITVPMVVVGPSLQSLFYDFQSLVSVPALDTSQVTNMGYTFYGCSSLTTIPALDTSQVTDMRSMFDGCSSLASVPALDTSKATDVYAMFKGCSSLTTIPALDTSQVTNMRSMFYDCSSLTSVPELNTSQVTDMYFMFRGCSSLTSVPALDTSQVTTMRTMFWGCSSLTSVPDMDTSNVTSMRFMFKGCSSLTSVPALDTSKATDVYEMFFGCSSLESVALPGMGNGFTTGSSEADRTLDMRDTKLNADASNALMQSLGTPAPGGTLQLPATATGADTSIATAKNWTVTIG